MNFIKEKGMFVVLTVFMMVISFIGSWSNEKMENASVEVDQEYVVAHLQ